MLAAMLALFVLAAQLQTGAVVERLAAQADPGVTYAYYLPKTYTPERKWPVLFVFDPRSRGAAAAELFREAAEEYGWIIASSNETRSDGPLEPNIRAINGMWPDVHQRFAVDRKRVYATGFSGGAILAWWLAESTNAVAGVIGVGGRVNAPEKITAVNFDWFGAAGQTDFNLIEMRLIEEKLAAAGSSRRLETFDGAHQWAPRELLAVAMLWMEVQAMRRGLRPRDEELIGRAFDQDLQRARNAPDELQSLRVWQTVARSFDGLRDLAAVNDEIARLEQSRAVRRLLADEKKAFELERAHRARLPGVLRSVIDADEAPTAPMLAHELRIAALQKTARDQTYQGAAARRVLETIFVQLNYYLAGQLSGPKLATVKSVARMIRPDAP
jgi:predicted esterase